MSKDGFVHLRLGMGRHSPCGRKVLAMAIDEEVQSSTDVEHLDKVTCLPCRATIVVLVREYNKARRAGTAKGWDK